MRAVLKKNKLFIAGFIFGIILSAFFDFAIWFEILIVLAVAITIATIGHIFKKPRA